MNNKYIITLKHPILRPGLEIKTESSEKYVVPVTNNLMNIAREINRGKEAFEKLLKGAES